ncbi:MAG: amino acid adenylation domain-containing protein, partial [Myxococcales bacterium]|nr:amino acid adenylation domain-containing protein [Myxococcales bacterium]
MTPRSNCQNSSKPYTKTSRPDHLHAADREQSWNGADTVYPREAGLAELFAAQVLAHPEAVAIQASSGAITYAELDRRASRLANVIRDYGAGLETPVGVLMARRVDHIIAQVALCKIGATCLPIDHKYPDERIALMLEDAGSALLLTDVRRGTFDIPCLCMDTDARRIAASFPECPPTATNGASRTHILYTSGSTGRPKGIEIVTRAISRLVMNTNYVRLSPGDLVGQFASFAFDAALFEVWGPLICGATIVPLLEGQAVDAHALRNELTASGVTAMFLTTSLFNLVAQTCPDAFRSLRTLLVGGERANGQAMRAVLETAPPEELWNVYGPTESTVFAVTHRFGPDDLGETNVPIGRPIANTRVFVLDSAMNPVPAGVPGELYIGGDGLARGYLQATLTQERFIVVDGLEPSGPIRLYKTGDRAQWREDGVLDFLGRADFQVKLRGHRIELEEVEAALVGTGLVENAVAAIEQGEQARLVAWVVPRDPEHFDMTTVQRRLRQCIPAYMVPARLRMLPEIPLSTNGKVDRKAVAQLIEDLPVPRKQAPTAAIQSTVADIWAELLGAEISEDDDFFAQGGDSLLAARLVLRVHQAFGVHVPVNALYAASTLRGFAAAVRATFRGEMSQDFGQGDPSVWRRAAELPPDLARQIEHNSAGASAPCGLLQARRILLTGATGFLGAFLLRDLLTHSEAEVSCLVRARSEAEGAARIEAAARKYGLWMPELAARIRPLPGDLRQRDLGLSPQRYAALADEIDVVLHSGAYVNYVQPYESHQATNVLGTLEILRLAAHGRVKPVHHVSTIAVFGPCGHFGDVERVHEDDDLDPYADWLRYDMGYAQSKWVCEQLVWAAARKGAPVCVYRPGFIMGDSHTGVGNPDDFVARLVAGCIQIGAVPDLPRQRKEFVPVDYVSRLLISIAAQPENLGHAFHLVPPDPATSVDLNDFLHGLEAVGYPLTRLPYDTWVQRLREDPRVMESALMPVLPM